VKPPVRPPRDKRLHKRVTALEGQLSDVVADLEAQVSALEEDVSDLQDSLSALTDAVNTILSDIVLLTARPLRGTHTHDIGTLQSSGTFTISHADILASHRLWVIETGNTGSVLDLRVQSISNGSAVIGWTASLQSGSRTFWWVAH
jgi:uncharacterized coiled-coil protein SlyX